MEQTKVCFRSMLMGDVRFVRQTLDLDVDPTEQQMESDEKIRICHIYILVIRWLLK